MVMSIDYNIMHRCFAHPSMDVLWHASGNSQGFPSILIPKENPICPGCTLGKMTSSSFLATDKHATMPFDKVHMDLKAMPVRSYHGYNYFIIFFDNNTSHSWTVNIKNKSNANSAIRQFIAKIKTQYGKQICEFQINAGGEFKSQELTEFLKELGVNILTSIDKNKIKCSDGMLGWIKYHNQLQPQYFVCVFELGLSWKCSLSVAKDETLDFWNKIAQGQFL